MQACGLILGSHPYDVLGMPQTHPVLVCCTHRVLGMPWEVTLTNDMQQRPIYELSFTHTLHSVHWIRGKELWSRNVLLHAVEILRSHHPGCIKLPQISSFSVLTYTFTVYRYVTTPQRLRPCKRPWELLIWTKGAYKPCQPCSHTVIDRIPKVWYLDYTIQAR
ncbi:hypothetical protein BC629DRAFT_265942 [Irpex lacteus]|nr:hypothetical protein BC629DRAFT_265942 [Irpex lacteus]